MQVTPDRASRTLVSEPPYESARLIGTAAPPPVGAIVIVAGDDPSGTLLDCLAHQRAFPWCPACIACSDLVREPQGVQADCDTSAFNTPVPVTIVQPTPTVTFTPSITPVASKTPTQAIDPAPASTRQGPRK